MYVLRCKQSTYKYFWSKIRYINNFKLFDVFDNKMTFCVNTQYKQGKSRHFPFI